MLILHRYAAISRNEARWVDLDTQHMHAYIQKCLFHNKKKHTCLTKSLCQVLNWEIMRLILKFSCIWFYKTEIRQVLNWECKVITSIFHSEEVSCWLTFSCSSFQKRTNLITITVSSASTSNYTGRPLAGWQTQNGWQGRLGECRTESFLSCNIRHIRRHLQHPPKYAAPAAQ